MKENLNSVAQVSSWAPFSESAFALLWTATLISNVGTWMHDVGAGWLMTTLDPSPTMVSLVQASTTFPIFLFALLAGALADRLNKKVMLLTINIFLFLIIVSLAILVEIEKVTPAILLLYTLVIGTAAAFMAPAWQAIVPSLVPKSQLQSAIALNSMGINISRAVGPAIAGILISSVSLTAPFAINAVSHLVIIAALLLWKPPAAQIGTLLPPEPIINAMVTGVRHATHNPALLSTMLRALGFFVFASSYWALLPLVARGVSGGGPELYGVLLGAVGVGAVVGALLLPRLRKRVGPDRLVLLGSVGTALVLVAFATSDNKAVIISLALVAGLSWILVLTSLNVSAQTSLPNWVRARGLAIYLMVFFGSMALGATLWGQVASLFSIQVSLLSAAILLLLTIPLTWHAKLGVGDQFDLSPSTHWPSPMVSEDMEGAQSRGPVMVSVFYSIDQDREHEFLSAIGELAKERYRDGAFQWNVFQESENSENWIESFLLADWSEHLRQHERVSLHDAEVQERVNAFHCGEAPPLVKHYIAPNQN